MPSGSYCQVEVKCPFYKYDDGKRRIVCEGAFDRDDSLAATFRRRDDYQQQIKKRCSGEYEQCAIYRMLMGKYEDE